MVCLCSHACSDLLTPHPSPLPPYRAISGGAVYVSDKPGEHDFDLLKRLVLPDGSVLRALQAARPCRDSLFTDVLRDGKSLLKVISGGTSFLYRTRIQRESYP